jgi:predicted transcriptional regulator
MPTGREIAAARTLLGIGQRELAEKAGLNAATINRMEQSGHGPVRGQGRNIQAVLDALRKGGVEIDDLGIRLIKKGKR